MGKDALERLFEDANSSSSVDVSKYSVDEQLEVNDDEDFLSSMSNESKDALFQKIQKVELEDEVEDNIEETKDVSSSTSDESTSIAEQYIEEMIYSENEELEEEKPKEEPPKRGRGRPRKNPVPEVKKEDNKEVKVKNNVEVNSVSAFMDSLAKDLIEELKNSEYTTRNFSKEQMLVILSHIENKI